MRRVLRLLNRFGMARAIALVLLVDLLLLRIWDPLPIEALRLRTFDLYQLIAPRVASQRPVVIVDIDEASLKALGQWPWPRTIVADLVTRATQMGALVIAFDVVFAEPDRSSPAEAVDSFRGLDDETRAKLKALPSNDTIFAAAIGRSRVVLGQTALAQSSARTGMDDAAERLVAEDEARLARRRPAVLAFHDLDVRTAYADGDRLDEHRPVARVGLRDVLEPCSFWRVRLNSDGFHVVKPSESSAAHHSRADH